MTCITLANIKMKSFFVLIPKPLQGLFQKAQVLYTRGEFEYALMYFHRGYKKRPELQEFRIGIQKCEEAIKNSLQCKIVFYSIMIYWNYGVFIIFAVRLIWTDTSGDQAIVYFIHLGYIVVIYTVFLLPSLMKRQYTPFSRRRRRGYPWKHRFNFRQHKDRYWFFCFFDWSENNDHRTTAWVKHKLSKD